MSGREDRDQPIGNRAGCRQPVEARCIDPVEVVVPEPVERDEDDIVAVDNLRMIRATCAVWSLNRLWWPGRRRPGSRTAGGDERDEGNKGNKSDEREDAAEGHDRCYRGCCEEGRCGRGRSVSLWVRLRHARREWGE